MTDIRIFIYCIIGFFLGLLFFSVGLLSFKRKRLMENIPTSKIRSLAMGLAEVYGEAVPAKGKLLRSPFSNSSCVYYSYKVQERRNSGKHSYWANVRSGSDGEYFFLKDDTGMVLVSTKGARFEITKDFEFDTHTKKKPSEHAMRFLEKHDIRHKGFLFKKRMRFTERFISPGDKVYAMGTAGDNPYVEDASSAHATKDIMMQKGKDESMYYISDKSEKQILSKLRWKIAGGLLGGGALIVGSLSAIFIYLRMF